MAIPDLFFLNIICKYVQKICRWLDAKPGLLVAEATALSTMLQPQPITVYAT